MSAEERVYSVDLLTRVEGEGSFYLRVRDGAVEEARLAIFEAPRLFEALLRGRSLFEVPDIVARICGICPVAYQMTAVRAIEGALGVAPSGPVVALRRLLYCGEWIESHALHVFLLHAPDFLGYPSAIEMARDHREVVERGLALKKAGNALIALLGGRAIHPVSPRVGGFTKVPRRAELLAMRAPLQRGLDGALEAVRWAASLPAPSYEQDYVFVALAAGHDGGHPQTPGGAYPIQEGDRIVVSDRAAVPVDAFDQSFVERQVPHSNALQCRLADGTPYLCGPMARINHHADKLHPVAAQALREHGPTLPVRNPYRSIVVRAVEIVHAFAEALDLIDGYVEPDRPFVEVAPRVATGAGATEAPRGLLWHRYELGVGGVVESARIVPPTSQNQARIEQDLAGIAPALLALPHDAATRRCEQLIRAYDPCISCATHFLRLTIDEGAP
jgi:coenzyme F420-reducing hydrogenase alpha subunit